MKRMPSNKLSRPLLLLLIVTALFTLLIQSGELGTSDTTHRLQVTHSLWTNEPQVFPNEYPEFGIHGRDGHLYASYGIGQSLLMLPADLVSTAASHLPIWRNYVASGVDPTVRSILVSCSTNIFVNVLTALIAYHLLLLLRFSVREAVLGTLGLLLATTHLHYAQNTTENNYIFLLTLTGLTFQFKWLLTGERRFLCYGSVALGLNLLTRITTILDIAAIACFLLMAMRSGGKQLRSTPRLAPGADSTDGPISQSLTDRILIYLQTALPVYGAFLILDRIYQYIRFGAWTDTYVAVLAREQRQLNPDLPYTFPFDGHWFQGGIHSGILGPLFSPRKSIFLFDPLLPLILLLSILLWKQLHRSLRAFLAASLLLVVFYIAFYGKYDSWGGDFAWGDRYVSSAVELVCLVALAVFVRYRNSLARTIKVVSALTIAWSVALQSASLAFWLPLEIYQAETFGQLTIVPLLRFKNIIAFAFGWRGAWGLDTLAMNQDPWDAAHLNSWNFLPSLLRHIGNASPGALHALSAVWLIATLTLIVSSIKLAQSLKN